MPLLVPSTLIIGLPFTNNETLGIRSSHISYSLRRPSMRCRTIWLLFGCSVVVRVCVGESFLRLQFLGARPFTHTFAYWTQALVQCYPPDRRALYPFAWISDDQGTIHTETLWAVVVRPICGITEPNKRERGQAWRKGTAHIAAPDHMRCHFNPVYQYQRKHESTCVAMRRFVEITCVHVRSFLFFSVFFLVGSPAILWNGGSCII